MHKVLATLVAGLIGIGAAAQTSGTIAPAVGFAAAKPAGAPGAAKKASKKPFAKKAQAKKKKAKKTPRKAKRSVKKG